MVFTAIGYQTILGYLVALCIYQIGTLVTAGTFGIGTVVAFAIVLVFIYLLFRPYKESNTLNVNIKKSQCKIISFNIRDLQLFAGSYVFMGENNWSRKKVMN